MKSPYNNDISAPDLNSSSNQPERCKCAEMTCPKECKAYHTHKSFFCEKCEPEACKKMEANHTPSLKSICNDCFDISQGYEDEHCKGEAKGCDCSCNLNKSSPKGEEWIGEFKRLNNLGASHDMKIAFIRTLLSEEKKKSYMEGYDQGEKDSREGMYDKERVIIALSDYKSRLLERVEKEKKEWGNTSGNILHDSVINQTLKRVIKIINEEK